MKKLFTLLFAAALLVGCGMNKKTEECCATNKVESDPITVSVKVLNSTDQDHFYFSKEGYIIFTEKYHLKRGYCCKNECKHCPF